MTPEAWLEEHGLELYEAAKPLWRNLIMRRAQLQQDRAPIENYQLHIARDHPAVPWIKRLNEGLEPIIFLGFPVQIEPGLPSETWFLNPTAKGN